MVKCSAYKCDSKRQRIPTGVTFHRFPKDKDLRNAWLTNMQLHGWKPKPSSVICSRHFEPHLFDSSVFMTRLKPGAIPTLFLEFPESNENLLQLRKRVKTMVPVLQETQNTMVVESTLPDCQIQHIYEGKPETSKLEMPVDEPKFSQPQSKRHEETLPMSYEEKLGTSKLEMPVHEPIVSQPQSKRHGETGPMSYEEKPGTSKLVMLVHEPKVSQPQSKRHGETWPMDQGCCCSSARDLKILKQKLISKNKSLRALREKTRRLKKKVAKFDDVIMELKNKLKDEDLTILKNIPISNNDFLIRYIKKAQNLKLESSYSPELRSFALQLNFYSPRSYNFVRQTFNSILPHPATISRWYKKVNAEPGFTTESFKLLDELSKKSAHKIFVNLSLDEMSIRKEQVWDGTKFQGHVDTGSEIQDDSLPLASLALVMFATAVNGVWKLPIAFFYITSMSGEQRANFVKIAVQLLTEVNIYISGLTFDGAAANISMATHLGCSFDLENLKPYFIINNKKIHVFWDPCHMLKLIRNTFGDFKTIIDNEGLQINFEFINQLMLLQKSKGLHLGNKLRQAHVLYNKQKMKVRLAAQLLSKSVASAINFARETLNLPEFQDSYATERFIILINDCFDILNSRSLRPPGFKKALCEANIVMTTEFVSYAIEYLKRLKFPNNQLIVVSARKTGFVGFIVSLTSALNMYQELVRKERLLFLPIYKISQDFLEMFFGKIRARGGFNDNPNVVQFKLAYKKNLIMSELSLNDSGLYTDHISILNTPSTSNVQKINCTTPSFNVNTNSDIDSKYSEQFINKILNHPLDDFAFHVIVYIAGFITRKFLKNVKCSLCQLLVIGDKEDFLFSLINVKDRGGLTYPSEGVIKIIERCEKYFKVAENVTAHYITQTWEYSDYLNLFHPGSGDNDHDAEHVYLIVKVIINYYVNIRNKHKAKEMQTTVSKRNFFKKIILFENK